VIGHVERDDAIAAGDVGIVQEVPELAAVGAGRVKAEQRDALPGFLDVDPVVNGIRRLRRGAEMGPPRDADVQVAADDWFEIRHVEVNSVCCSMVTSGSATKTRRHEESV